MKHVWILNHYAQTPGGVGGTRHFSLARHLSAYGWKATIIAASTDHATGTQRLAEGESSRLEICNGVPFLWLRTPAYSGNGVGRIRNIIAYTYAALMTAGFSNIDRPDVVIGSSVHPLAAWAGRRLARRYGVPFVFEVRDLWPQTLIDMGLISRNHPLAIALRWLEISLYRSAERIITLLPKAGDYIGSLGILPDKVTWISNGVDLDALPPRAKGIGSPTTFTLMYFGAFGEANGLDTLLSAMRLVQGKAKDGDILLRMIGEGPKKHTLMLTANELGLRNVRFEDAVPKDEIPALAAQADGFVLCVRDLPGLYRFGISMNKIFDYMAAGRPTIISVEATNNPVAEGNAGIVVPPQNATALASAILELCSLSLAERAEMGAAARRHVEEKYDMKFLAGRLARTLDEATELV